MYSGEKFPAEKFFFELYQKHWMELKNAVLGDAMVVSLRTRTVVTLGRFIGKSLGTTPLGRAILVTNLDGTGGSSAQVRSDFLSNNRVTTA
jgi:hypothetical protein